MRRIPMLGSAASTVPSNHLPFFFFWNQNTATRLPTALGLRSPGATGVPGSSPRDLAPRAPELRRAFAPIALKCVLTQTGNLARRLTHDHAYPPAAIESGMCTAASAAVNQSGCATARSKPGSSITGDVGIVALLAGPPIRLCSHPDRYEVFRSLVSSRRLSVFCMTRQTQVG